MNAATWNAATEAERAELVRRDHESMRGLAYDALVARMSRAFFADLTPLQRSMVEDIYSPEVAPVARPVKPASAPSLVLFEHKRDGRPKRMIWRAEGLALSLRFGPKWATAYLLADGEGRPLSTTRFPATCRALCDIARTKAVAILVARVS